MAACCYGSRSTGEIANQNLHSGDTLTGPILILVDDLIFLSKIQQTARQVGVPIKVVEPSNVVECATEFLPRAVILDLNHRSGAAVITARNIKSNPVTSQVQVVAFLSHVQTDLAAEAREAGCDMVMARSAFSQQLPQLLLKFAG